ncbi:MAG: WecB/TagA/CpsF family glycosyltransferase [Candidatus Riflebacteria bacterium]|nr:WecB/TagA/CpsF family glycosyltransferase [Candidatus Riflebacteria bacterium]
MHMILSTLLLSLLGMGIVYGIGKILIRRYVRNSLTGRRQYRSPSLGGFILLGGIAGALLTPGLYVSSKIMAMAAVLACFVILGLIRDLWKTPWSVILPYQFLLIIVGAYFDIVVSYPVRWVEILLTLAWPIIILGCIKLASVIEEMPFLLGIESGLTFLLFFPNQASTPPEVVICTITMITISAVLLCLFVYGQRNVLGNSCLMPLGYLIAGISMLGNSKSLLMFGLLIPSMVVIYPFASICFIIMFSYLGNELYQTDPSARQSHYRWILHRDRVIVFTGMIFLTLNFGGLLLIQHASWPAYISLIILISAMFASFFRTFASRDVVSRPPLGSRIRILGVAIDAITPVVALDRISEAVDSGDVFFHVITADSLAVMRALHDKGFAGIMERANMTVPDGAGLVWSADFLGIPLPGRVPGVALVNDLCCRAVERGWNIFFLGAAPGRADQAVAVLKERYPGLIVAGIHHGFFAEGSELEDLVLKKIAELQPRIILVAMGVPRQELIICRLRGLLRSGIAIGVGGSLDVISGALPRAPVLMQRFACEWLFRLWKEPRRFRRMLAIPEFVLAVLRAKWREVAPKNNRQL